MHFSDLIQLTATTTGGGSPTTELSWWENILYNYGSFIFLGVMILIMYFVMIRPQQKKQKEEQQMRNNLRVGDELTTIGGICGRVLSIKDDTITIETSVDRNKMQFKKWAIQSVETKHDAPVDDDDDDDDDI